MGYINILKENLKQRAQHLNLGEDFCIIQDNDPKHTAHNVKLWLLYSIGNQLHSPTKSHDINPMERLGDFLERKILQQGITSKDMLKRVIITEWNNVSSEETQTVPIYAQTIEKGPVT
ncbi:hypothetical protein AVEN_68940-1 [Araneus ventricosus]|uniref:Tc1-like transposase DDE domain-containing protein n=1 Tax=Araneus ventricosus TaxID=182803 RepID=A0A4Y2HHZ6_ARAVE|nr:hypothetical protein AVEN_68940-1 [Araneus ventricosus]